MPLSYVKYKTHFNRNFLMKKNLYVSKYFPNIHLTIYIDRANETTGQGSKYQVTLTLNDYLRRRKKRKKERTKQTTFSPLDSPLFS